MKTILIRYYDPSEIMGDTSSVTDEEIKEACFRVNHYKREIDALMAYAETPCTWSTLLDEFDDLEKTKKTVEEFIDVAYRHIKAYDLDWLEQNFV